MALKELTDGVFLPCSTCDMNCRVRLVKIDNRFWVRPHLRRYSTNTSRMASVRMWSLYSTKQPLKMWIANHSLWANFRIRRGCRVQTAVCRFCKIILTGFANCENERKQERSIFRLTFLSAGARTRTWSLLVRSQTLYPVGLHPLDWWPKDSLKRECCQGFLLKIF